MTANWFEKHIETTKQPLPRTHPGLDHNFGSFKPRWPLVPPTDKETIAARKLRFSSMASSSHSSFPVNRSFQREGDRDFTFSPKHKDSAPSPMSQTMTGSFSSPNLQSPTAGEMTFSSFRKAQAAPPPHRTQLPLASLGRLQPQGPAAQQVPKFPSTSNGQYGSLHPFYASYRVQGGSKWV